MAHARRGSEAPAPRLWAVEHQEMDDLRDRLDQILAPAAGQDRSFVRLQGWARLQEFLLAH